MSDDLAPNWALLPAKPREFFRLATNFDRRQLRQAYARLIRRYKPERHPREFQRIRAAYELLERQVVWREAPSRPSVPLGSGLELLQSVIMEASNSDPTPIQPRAAKRSPRPPQPARPQRGGWQEQLAMASPAAAYAELQATPHPTDEQFLALAFLSDVVEPDQAYGFGRWLMRGVVTWPHSPALVAVVREYFASLDDVEEIEALLAELGRLHLSDRVVELTEPLWAELLARCEPGACPAIWSRWQTQTPFLGASQRLSLDLLLLERAIWNADLDWLDQRLSELDRFLPYLVGGLSAQLDYLVALVEYRRHRTAFLQAPCPALCRAMDQVLRASRHRDPAEFHRQFLAVQVRLARYPDEACQAFPFPLTPASFAAAQAWQWLNQIQEQRQPRPYFRPRPPHEEREAILHFLRTFKRRTSLSLTRLAIDLYLLVVLGAIVTFYVMTFLVVCLSVCMFALAWPSPKDDFVVAISSVSLGIALTGIVLSTLHFQLVGPWWARLALRNSQRYYRLRCRRPLAEFLADSTWQLEQFRNQLVTTPPNLSSTAGWLRDLCGDDSALSLISQAVRWRV